MKRFWKKFVLSTLVLVALYSASALYSGPGNAGLAWRVYFVYPYSCTNEDLCKILQQDAISVLSRIDDAVFLLHPFSLPKPEQEIVEECNQQPKCILNSLAEFGATDVILFSIDTKTDKIRFRAANHSRTNPFFVPMLGRDDTSAILELIRMGVVAYVMERELLSAELSGHPNTRGAIIASRIGRIKWKKTERMKIPAGTYTIGSNVFENSQPEHEVEISGFFMDKTETTVWDYTLCVLSGVCSFPKTHKEDKYCTYGSEGGMFMPINCVTWQQARQYCSFVGGRLPTESEWEAAARGPKANEYPWGNDEPTCTKAIFSDPRLGDGCGADSPAIAGSLPEGKSVFGLLDMSGNLWEWVADYYQKDAYKYARHRNPQGPVNGRYKVIRGGSWLSKKAVELTTWYRGHRNPLSPSNGVGFRCVYDW